MAKNKLNLVVAVSKNRGIGINGQLPWRLKGDLAFFKQLTTATVDPGKKNAVIMGRKTWDSIPSKFRPLPGRVNVVLSRNLSAAPGGAILASSLDDALDRLDNFVACGSKIEKIFIIGGSSVYEEALNHPCCHRIYITNVLRDFDCDTYMPDFDRDQYRTISLEDVPNDIQTDADIQYQFQVLEKV